MDRADFTAQAPGELIDVAGQLCFVPARLPPHIDLSTEVVSALDRASHAVGVLAGFATLAPILPRPDLLAAPYVAREAVLSSRIEGTRTTLSDLYAAAVGREDLAVAAGGDIREVSNYVSALEWGLRRLDELPLSLRLIRELHGRLMHGVGGGGATAGDFRRIQNFIGRPGATIAGATYVPPPVPHMHERLADLEQYLHDNTAPALLQATIAHYQFEAIHPFVDGNGRVGRLLLVLVLRERGVLREPLLHLSAHFERTRTEYYTRLLAVSTSGDWHGWLLYVLRGIEEQALQVVADSQRMLAVRDELRARLEARRTRHNALRLVDELFVNPYVTARSVAVALSVSDPAARAAIAIHVAAGILREVTGRGWGRAYVADEVLAAIGGGGR